MIGITARQKVLFKFPAKYKKSFGIQYIKPLYKLAVLFGLAPYYDFENEKHKLPRYYLVPQVLMGIAISLSYIHFLDGSIEILFKNRPLTEIVVDSVLYIFISMLDFVCVVVSSLLKRKRWRKMLQNFQKIDKVIGKQVITTSQHMFLIKTIVESSLVLLILGYECWTFIRVFRFHRYKFYLFQRLQYYFVFIAVELICNFALSIKYRMQFFNDFLDYTVRIRMRDKKLFMNMTKSEFYLVIDVYFNLNQLINLYNEVFGWEILLLMGTVMMALLECLNFVLVRSASAIPKFKEELFENELLVLSILMTFMILLWGIMVIFCCDNANREAHRTATICYQLLTELPDSSPETEKLLYLAQHAAHRCPQITAANVFVVNINALFGIMGSLTSYVIVLISFNNNNSSTNSPAINNSTNINNSTH